ncbi:MAG: BON domain-containing protein [Acidobacteriaceae bacterium]
MTATDSNLHPLFRHRTALVRGLTICAVLSGVALFGVTASAQTAPPAQTATSTQSATTASTDQRPDSAIAEDINKRLMASSTLRPLDLGIWVHDGTATLTGTVPTQELREEAETMVKAVDGVKNVEDKIAIGAAPETAPGFASQNGGEPGNAQGPPPPPPGYGENQNAPPPPPEYGANPRPDMVTVAPGTPAYVMVMQTIDSKHTKVGTRFHGILVQDIVVQNGVIAVPRGADVTGVVVDARGPGHLRGRPHLALQLTGLNIASTSYPLSSQIWARGGPGKGGQSAANIGGSAAAGAMIGGAVGGGSTALLGGLLGGLGGAGLSSLSSGPRLIVPAESVVTFYLNAPVTVREPSMGEIRELGSRVPPAAYGRPVYGRRYPPPPGYPPPGYYPPPGGYPY